MPPPTQAAINTAQADAPAPLEIHETQKNRVVVHVGRRVRITAAPGETRTLTIAFTGELPFASDSATPHEQRSTAAPFPTSRRGTFRFDCFLNGVQVAGAGYAGELEVGPPD